MPESAATATFADANDVCGPIAVRNSYMVDISIDGTTGTSVFTLQRSFDSGTTWEDIKTYSADVDEVAQNGSPCQMRIIFTTDGGGTPAVQLRAGNAY